VARATIHVLILAAALVGGGCGTRATSSAKTTVTPDDWARVERLRAGTRVRIRTSQLLLLDAPLERITATAMTLRGAGRRQQDVPRADVRQIDVVDSESGIRGGIGLTVGFAAGAFYAWAVSGGQADRAFVGLYGLGTAALGGLAGGLSGLGKERVTTVYVARASLAPPP
jgi:hypothetical protein